MEGVRIEAIGPEDPRFAEWHAAIVRSYAHGREPGWWESLAATRIYFARASAQTRHVALVASLDGSVVGGAELSLPLDADRGDDVGRAGCPAGHARPRRR